jgi:hypothetical protein
MALRWKKDERPRGLAGVVSGPRGSALSDGAVKYATVSAKRNWGDGPRYSGWYWVAGWTGSGIPYKTTCDEPAPDEATAKAEAMAYVKKHRQPKGQEQTK